jgi:hypothetical protein
MSSSLPFELRIGDSLVPLDAELFRTNAQGVSAAADLTAHTVTFTLINAATGTALFTDDPVTITTAASGLVRYVWDAADITTAGIYRGTFTATSGGKDASFPVNPLEMQVWIHGPNQTAQAAYKAAIQAG